MTFNLRGASPDKAVVIRRGLTASYRIVGNHILPNKQGKGNAPAVLLEGTDSACNPIYLCLSDDEQQKLHDFLSEALSWGGLVVTNDHYHCSKCGAVAVYVHFENINVAGATILCNKCRLKGG